MNEIYCSSFSLLLIKNELHFLCIRPKLFSRQIGHNFTSTSIRITAITGSAATEIGGSTSAQDYKYMSPVTQAGKEDIDSFKDTRMNVCDECSMAGHNAVLAKISGNLQHFTECYEQQYGKHAFVFIGDFRQLENIGGDCIYEHKNGIHWEQALNCMVELKGKHRFADCEQMGQLMNDMRDMGLSQDNIDLLNTRVVGTTTNGKKVELPDPFTTRYAVARNLKRCEINAGVFKQFLAKHHKEATKDNIPFTAIVIKAKARWGRIQKDLTFLQRKVLFEECCESHCKDSKKKYCDPLLCLCYETHVMGTQNEDVNNGQANGTTSLLERVILKHGAKLKPMQMHGCWVNAVDIDDVDHLLLRWCKLDRFQGTCKQHPGKGTFKVQHPFTMFGKKQRIGEPIQMTQFLIVINHATTVHKLQGKTLDALVVAQISKQQNWLHVALSRVRRLQDLHLMEPIPDDIDTTPVPEYLDMMERLRQSVLASNTEVDALKSTIQSAIDTIKELLEARKNDAEN